MTCFSVKSGHISPHIVIKEAFLLKSTYLDDGQNITSEPLLNLAATLASHGYINDEKISWPQTEGLQLKLVNLDVSSVPAADLASLARCARDLVMLFNVTGDVTPLITNAKCRELDIRKNSEVKSLALVTAMVGNVKSLLLGNEVTLDMETLAQYDGKGECEKVLGLQTKVKQKLGKISQSQRKPLLGPSDVGKPVPYDNCVSVPISCLFILGSTSI